MAVQHGQLSHQHHSNVLLALMHGDYKPPTDQKFCVMDLQTEMSVSVIVDFHFHLLSRMSANPSWGQTSSPIFTLLPITGIKASSTCQTGQQYLCVSTRVRKQTISPKSIMSAKGKTLTKNSLRVIRNYQLRPSNQKKLPMV